jgi:hypothetical protein
MLAKIKFSDGSSAGAVNPDQIVNVSHWTEIQNGRNVRIGTFINLVNGKTVNIKLPVDEVIDMINEGATPQSRLVTLTGCLGNDMGVDPSLVKTVVWNSDAGSIRVELVDGFKLGVKGPESRIGEVIAKLNREEIEINMPLSMGRTLEI